MTTPTIETTARNADLSDLADILRRQHEAKVDVVAPATAIRSRDGVLQIEGTDPVLTDSGVNMTAGSYRPTAVCDEGLADKMGVPVGYLKRLRAERPDLYDANLNGWLQGWRSGVKGHKRGPAADPDGRSFLVRGFRSDEGEGVARAFLSDGYKFMDHLDVLGAALDGVRDSGAEVEVEGCDLSERRMSVRIAAPAIQALAPTLLANYRSPFEQGVDRAGWTLERARQAAEREGLGFAPGGEPIVFAGFVLNNSETGGGAFSITPRLIVLACRNGLTIGVDAVRAIHLGGTLDEGIVQWSEDTQRRTLDLVKAKARDAVATFLDVEYVTRQITRIEEAAGVRITQPAEQVRLVAKSLRLTEAQTDDVLSHFILGGQMTAGGVMNAVTSVAQTVADPDDAHALEGLALRALEQAALVGSRS